MGPEGEPVDGGLAEAIAIACRSSRSVKIWKSSSGAVPVELARPYYFLTVRPSCSSPAASASSLTTFAARVADTAAGLGDAVPRPISRWDLPVSECPPAQQARTPTPGSGMTLFYQASPHSLGDSRRTV